MTILESAAALRARKVSSAELVKASLDSIARLQPALNAFLTVLPETAMARAREMDDELAKGKVRGPLHGVPVAVKDVFCTKGVRTTCGSKLFTDHIPDRDAAVVERLETAGASEPIFDDAGIDALFEQSGGVPRKINRLCDLALLVAYADGLTAVTPSEVEAVVDELVAVVQ